MGRVTAALKKALGLNSKRPVWQAMVSRSQPGICEIRIGEEGKNEYICDLKSTAQFLRCKPGGQIDILSDVERPRAGVYLIVIPASCKDNARIAFWGFADELVDVSDEQVAIGSGKTQKKQLEAVVDNRTSRRLGQTIERRDPRAFKKSVLKRIA